MHGVKLKIINKLFSKIKQNNNNTGEYTRRFRNLYNIKAGFITSSANAAGLRGHTL